MPTGIIYDLTCDSDTFEQIAVNAHNIHRANHSNTDPISYNKQLAEWAKIKADSCTWSEDLYVSLIQNNPFFPLFSLLTLYSPAEATNVGMNIGDGTYVGPANISATIEDMWYNSEIGLFPAFGQGTVDMALFEQWGHFSQVVWQATKEVGCWSSPCGTGTPIGSGYFTGSFSTGYIMFRSITNLYSVHVQPARKLLGRLHQSWSTQVRDYHPRKLDARKRMLWLCERSFQ